MAIVHESWGDIESWMIDGAEKVAAARRRSVAEALRRVLEDGFPVLGSGLRSGA